MPCIIQENRNSKVKCSCVWLVVSVGAHNFHIECGSLGGVPYIYLSLSQNGIGSCWCFTQFMETATWGRAWLRLLPAQEVVGGGVGADQLGHGAGRRFGGALF